MALHVDAHATPWGEGRSLGRLRPLSTPRTGQARRRYIEPLGSASVTGHKAGMLESMETPEHERREIERYVRSQFGPDFEIEHMEKLASEYVLGTQYDVWDAHTNEGRWWVIRNPMNL